MIKGRTVRISLASEDDKDKDKSSRSMGGSFTRNRGEDRYDGPDKTTGDWRSNAQSSGGDDKGKYFYIPFLNIRIQNKLNLPR